MGAPRFFVAMGLSPGDAGRELALPEASAHHALRVLRLVEGDPLVLFTGTGGEYAATLVRADRRNAWVRLDAYAPVEREAANAITLVQGVAASDAMDFVVRRAVEMGAAAVRPVVTTRSARVPDGERAAKRLAHWRQIAIAACEQCGRNRVPPIHAAVDIGEFLRDRAAGRAGVVLAPEATVGIGALSIPCGELDILIGPEGGFTQDEIAHAVRSGVTAMRMGVRIMRTETAAVAALSAVSTLWGEFT
jgi:16S rRNA (uracil1498-N3)-methyltransferase